MSTTAKSATAESAVSETGEPLAREHPIAPFVRSDRMPHIWCPTCGIGTVMKCYVTALQESGIDLDKVSVVSGIGCTGRVAGYLELDGFHTTHGRAIPFATGLKLGRPELSVHVFSGGGDLVGIELPAQWCWGGMCEGVPASRPPFRSVASLPGHVLRAALRGSPTFTSCEGVPASRPPFGVLFVGFWVVARR